VYDDSQVAVGSGILAEKLKKALQKKPRV
jgi:hypothetical protein